MKKVLFSMLLFAPAVLAAQPVLTYQTHGLRAGESHGMQKVEYLSPGNAEAKQVWDFRSVSPIDPQRIETIDNGEAGKLKVTSADGSKFTYTCNEYANVYEGYVSTGRTIEFEKPITKIKYPFGYGSRLAGDFNGHCYYGANLSHAGTIAGSFSSEADAYGVLRLPNDVTLHNVLRVKTRESYVESLCSHVHIETVKYLWYAPEYRYPVLVTWEISYSYENGETKTVTESFYTTEKLVSNTATPVIADTPKPAQEDPVDIKYTVYPNPYNSYFHLTYTLEKETMVNIALYTASGQFVTFLVKNQKQNGVQHVTYNPISADFAGMYVVRLLFDDKVYTKTLIKD
ncbi:MAG: T9SS type A sorting domain-containing protein [Prevotellaceae bacterium]|jgi:hypothetical protein|nr:T9SS type A sorting domain-containing protein [Prevotellaceae bacterium]